MAQVVIFLDDDYDSRLRRLAKQRYGKKKAAMARIVKRGIELVEREQERGEAHQKLLGMVKNAKKLGIGKFRREEIYDRNIG